MCETCKSVAFEVSMYMVRKSSRMEATTMECCGARAYFRWLEDAMQAAQMKSRENPVGFDIVDRVSGAHVGTFL